MNYRFARGSDRVLMRARTNASMTPTTQAALMPTKPQVKVPALSFTTPSA